MAYVKTDWENDVTPLNADNMNKIELGIAACQIKLTPGDGISISDQGVISVSFPLAEDQEV